MAYNIHACAVASIVIFATSVVLTLLRFYTRRFISKRFWLDDWFALLGLICKIIEEYWSLDGFYNGGWGQPPESISSVTAERGFRALFFCEISYALGTNFVKTAFAIMLLRFLTNKLHIQLIHLILGSIAFMIVFFICFIMLYCTPVRYFWTQEVDPYHMAIDAGVNPKDIHFRPLGHCKDSGEIATYLHAISMIILDTTLGLVLPFLVLRKMRMRLPLKIVAMGLLAMGAIPSVASIGRICFTKYITAQDALYSAMPLFFWSDLELSCSLIGTSLATLKPLANKLGMLRDPNQPIIPAASWRSDWFRAMFLENDNENSVQSSKHTQNDDVEKMDHPAKEDAIEADGAAGMTAEASSREKGSVSSTFKTTAESSSKEKGSFSGTV